MKRFIFILSFLILAACSAVSTQEPTAAAVKPIIIQVEENPYRPQPEDVSLTLAGAIINNTGLVERFDLDPFRVELSISGSVPSVCNELRINVEPPNANFQIMVEVYSLINKDVDCDNVFQQFEANLLLGVYSNGRYTVWVNDGYAGDFITY
jgi:hypothetical protein